MHRPLVIVPHCGLLIPGDIPKNDWPHEFRKHDPYADWVYDLNGLVPDVSVFKFPYSPAVVDVDREREAQASEATDHYDFFYSAIAEVECSYALIGHTSHFGSVDSAGNRLSAHAVVLDGEKFKGMYLSAAPKEHTTLFAESLKKATPSWKVELNTTYRDEHSALRRNFKALGVPALTVVVDETLYFAAGKVDVGRLNVVRHAIADAFNAVLTEFPS